MAANEDTQTPIAIWYFVGATFIFALPMTLFPDMEWWVRVGTLVVGFALVAVGGWQLSREIRGRIRSSDQPPQA